jgi:hypothetical protein
MRRQLPVLTGLEPVASGGNLMNQPFVGEGAGTVAAPVALAGVL